MDFFDVRWDFFKRIWQVRRLHPLQQCCCWYLQGVPHIRNGGHHDAIGVHDRLTGLGVVLEDAADGDSGFPSLVLMIWDRDAPWGGKYNFGASSTLPDSKTQIIDRSFNTYRITTININFFVILIKSSDV